MSEFRVKKKTPEGQVLTFNFGTENEREAFLQGVEEAERETVEVEWVRDCDVTLTLRDNLGNVVVASTLGKDAAIEEAIVFLRAQAEFGCSVEIVAP